VARLEKKKEVHIMGYYHHNSESDVKLSKGNLAALEQQLGKSIFDLAEEQDYTIYISGDDNGVENIEFEESKRWDDGFYDDISPFVTDGSYVQISDDDGNVFRLMYRSGKMYRVSPKWEIPE
jgi:hypothetical protein